MPVCHNLLLVLSTINNLDPNKSHQYPDVSSKLNIFLEIIFFFNFFVCFTFYLTRRSIYGLRLYCFTPMNWTLSMWGLALIGLEPILRNLIG